MSDFNEEKYDSYEEYSSYEEYCVYRAESKACGYEFESYQEWLGETKE
jgi:hypothetical protein